MRSVPARLSLTVPAETTAPGVTLTDTVADLATTGTVTVANPVFDLAATTGTVVVSYDPGTTDRAITNCAHLRSASGEIDLQSCDTQPITPAPACAPGTTGCGWADGDMVTYSQDSWGTIDTTASILLGNYFDGIYASFGGAEIGPSGAAGFSALFSPADAVLDCQPADGFPDVLDNDLLDPTSTSSGVFGGYVLALTLDVDYSDAGTSRGPRTCGDLRLCGLTGTQAPFNNTTMRQFLAAANQALGGGASLDVIDAMSQVSQDLIGSQLLGGAFG